MKIINEILGIAQTPVSHAEKSVSALGGFVGILCIFIISQWAVGSNVAALMVASMGASAVLLFAVPHGPLSQPWSLFGGHIVSAIVGVSCAKFIPNEVFAASLAVGAAIGAMYYLRCIHPPGGATAISAVIGGDTVHELGYQYVFTPVLLNVLVILLVAIIFNYAFAWRRYPTYLHRHYSPPTPASPEAQSSHIAHEDFVYALSEIDSFVDIDEHDLLRIYDIATRKSKEYGSLIEHITIGGFYSNGENGDDWSVRQIVDESRSDDKSKDMLIFKVVAGRDKRSSGYCTRTDFLRWANHQVVRDEQTWKKISGLE